MPKLPVLSGSELIEILKSLGYVVVRQKGSHVSLQKEQYKKCGLSKDDIIR
jgi:predicted RNA binding protein YcfA (HicA-like mRNA interferase family)